MAAGGPAVNWKALKRMASGDDRIQVTRKQYYPDSKMHAEIIVKRVFMLDGPPGDSDSLAIKRGRFGRGSWLFLLVLERHMIPNDGSEPYDETRFEFWYWGEDRNGRMKFGQFPPHLTIENFRQAARLLDGWLHDNAKAGGQDALGLSNQGAMTRE